MVKEDGGETRSRRQDAARDPVKIIVIGGPTASGKSEIAVQIAQEFGGVVINADSMQVYQELRIVTARPDDAALSVAPHALYGALPAATRCSAGMWRGMAVNEIEKAGAANLLPVVVGGTGLYLKALTEGIAAIPDVPAEAVEQVTAWIEASGIDAGRQRLWDVDPETAERLKVIDRQRLIRALSVYDATGQPLSHWAAQAMEPPRPALSCFRIAVLPERDSLYPRINHRFAWMIVNGALEEVASLDRLNLDVSLPAMKAVGVAQIRAYLEGEVDRAKMIERGQAATRQYAKRQFTWFRRQFCSPDAQFAQFSESIRDELFNKIRQFRLTD